MSLYLTISSFAVASVTLFFLFSILLKGLRNKKNLTFCFFSISVFVWSFGHLFWQISTGEERAVFWLRILVFGSSFIPYTYLHFVSHFVNRPMPKLIGAGYLIAAVFAVLAWTPLIFSGVEPRMGFAFWPIAGPAFIFYFLGFAIVVLLCFSLLIQHFRRSSVKVRNQNKYLILGTAVGFAGGATNFPLWLNIQIPPFLHGLSIFYILGIGYSVLKYRLLDFNEVAVRTLLLVLLSGVFGFLLAAFLVLIVPLGGGEWELPGFLTFGALLSGLSLLFLLLGPRLRDWFDGLIQSKILSERFSYRSELRSIANNFISAINQEGGIASVVCAVQEAMGLDFAAVYTRSGFELEFRCESASGARPQVGKIESGCLEPLLRRISVAPHALFLEEEMDRSKSFQASMARVFDESRIIRPTDVILPIALGGRCYGFFILGSSSLAGAYAEVDVLLLENICAQYALALKAKEIERKASSVEKLVSLGTMAAGLSHELRNPLVSIRTLGSFMDKSGSGGFSLDPEFSKTVQRDIRRISGIVDGVAAFSEEKTGPVRFISVVDALKEAEFSMKSKFKLSEIAFKIESVGGAELGCVLGSFDQLVQVFQNVIENATNAIAEWDKRPFPGCIEVKVRTQKPGGFEAEEWVEVRIKDNGPGITQELQTQIFEPFVTSRNTGARSGASGTGLGLAIVQQILERHKARISVQSNPGEGAEFIISLPRA